MVGGGLLVGANYWYLYLTAEGSVDTSFDLGGLAIAMEAGGPMGRIGGWMGGGGHPNEAIDGVVGKVSINQCQRQLRRSLVSLENGIQREALLLYRYSI
jgi:hypothetical protein